jgi:intraflagellar transport protein 56
VLQTVEEYLKDLDEFNYNKGMTLASLSRWAEAERCLLAVKNPLYTQDMHYISWLCRCYIRTKKIDQAWRLYVDATTTEMSKALLHIIASDCYCTGSYYYAMRAYDAMSKYEGNPAYKEGLIASAVGVFRGVLTRKLPAEKLGEIISILSGEPEAAQALQSIKQYAQEVGELDLDSQL